MCTQDKIEITNSLYYTFSTISQVLGAFIALSGVFVIFKIQEIKKILFIQVQYFYNYLNGVTGLFVGSFHDCPTIAVTLKTLHKSECLGGMKSEMEKILADENVKKGYEFDSLNRMKNIFDNVDSFRLKLLYWTKFSIITGLITIVFSITILTLTPWINFNTSILLYIIGLIGFLASVGSMVSVIFLSLMEKNHVVNKLPSS